MYESIAVANYFLELAEKEGDQSVTPMKLQKLVYIAHGWHLAIYDRPLIKERVEAWDWGPVIRELYDAFKHFGSDPITGRGKVTKFTLYPNSYNLDVPIVDPVDTQTTSLLDEVWSVYKEYDGLELGRMTHIDGAPWSQAWRNRRKGDRNIAIDDTIIKEYYGRLWEQAKQRAEHG